MSSTARAAPARIVIAGDGPVGILAAIALRRALPATDVLIVGNGPNAPADDARLPDAAPADTDLSEGACDALPFTNRLHRRLGIDETVLIRRAGASHRLLIRWQDWARPGADGRAAYGDDDGAAHGGMIAPLALAEAGRFASPGADADEDASNAHADHGNGGSNRDNGRGGGGDLLTIDDHALRWHPGAYRAVLIERAQAIGVRHHPGPLRPGAPDGEGGLATVRVAGAEPIAADLIIDTASAARLIGGTAAAPGWVDWTPAGSADRLAIGAAGAPRLALHDTVCATGAGWLLAAAGRDGARRWLGVDRGASDAAIVAALGGEPDRVLPLRAGRRAVAWAGNVVAIGDAAAMPDPLPGLTIDLAHRQIALLLDLLPGLPACAAERDEYNRRFVQMADAARDMTAASALARARSPDASAVPAVGSAAPRTDPRVTEAIAQYRRRGQLPLWDDAPLSQAEWRAQCGAQGLVAGNAAASIASDPARDAAARQRLAARIGAVPLYRDWLAGVIAGR